MKKSLFIILILSFIPCKAQNLTLDEAVSLRKQNLAIVEESLTDKNWKLIEAKETTTEKMAVLTFAFNKGEFDDKADAFFQFMYSDETKTQRISIQLNRKEFYDKWISRIKSLGCRIINSKVKNGEIVKVYQGKTTTFEISVATQKSDFPDTKTYYNIFMISNEDYNRNFVED